MSNEATTLLDVIRPHPERPLLIHQDELFTPSCLFDGAQDLRGRYPALAAARVALQFSSSIDLLTKLIALDGHAAELLILPPDLSADAAAHVLSGTDASYLLNENGLSAIGPESAKAQADEGTRWLFTTSGTTGLPKVYAHTLQSLMTSTRPARNGASRNRWGLAYQAHRFAGIQVFLQALVGGDVLVVPSATDINTMVATFVLQQVDTLSATPSLWRNFLSQGAIAQCPLQQITLGGEIADQAILSALARRFPAARIVHIYASTEAGVGFSVTDGKAGFPEAWLNQAPPLEMKISASGSLLIRGPAMSRSDSLRQRLDAQGYLDTQDRVRASGGRIHFLGRATGIINVGGNKVHPEEVENLVREMPGVQNALVSAKSSPIMGELVLLEVQAGDLSAEESRNLKRRIRDHCQQHLPKYKVPALINIVQSLAVSESGKVERKHTA